MATEFTPIIDRQRMALNHLAESLATFGELDSKTADKLAGFYLRHKLARLDNGVGRSMVKHGAYLEKDVIARAVAMMNGETA